MAALRQLLNARGTEAKMAALGYQISGPQVPDKNDQDRTRASKVGDQSNRSLHSKFNNETEASAWQHPLLRKDQSPDKSQEAYGRSNSFDDYGHSRPHHLMRTQTDTTVAGPTRDDNGFSMDVSSIYEDNESPALSPALNQHLALRPLNTQTSAPLIHDDSSAKPVKQRRRSRSATQDSNTGYYGADPWESYRKDPPNNLRRKESLKALKPAEDSNSAPVSRDRQRSPTPLHKVRSTSSQVGPCDTDSFHKNKYDPSSPDGVPVKVAHNTFSSTSSPTDSAGNSINEQQGHMASESHPHHPRNLKRKRSLDYGTEELQDMDYVRDLQEESFDVFPSLSNLISTHNLPDSSLPLSDRLRDICNTPTPRTQNTAPTHPSSDKNARAQAFFASLSIDQYEDCGELILDGLRNVMDRLRQARREKRKAARGMEELVAKREEWVRKKRGVLEGEMGRLRGAGVAVIKPVNARKGR